MLSLDIPAVIRGYPYTYVLELVIFDRFLGIDRKRQHVVDRDSYPVIDTCVYVFGPPSSCWLTHWSPTRFLQWKLFSVDASEFNDISDMADQDQKLCNHW